MTFAKPMRVFVSEVLKNTRIQSWQPGTELLLWMDGPWKVAVLRKLTSYWQILAILLILFCQESVNKFYKIITLFLLFSFFLFVYWVKTQLTKMVRDKWCDKLQGFIVTSVLIICATPSPRWSEVIVVRTM